MRCRRRILENGEETEHERKGKEVKAAEVNVDLGLLDEKKSKAIQKAAHTGKIGDGKIFVTNIEQVVRIRTGEQNEQAL